MFLFVHRAFRLPPLLARERELLGFPVAVLGSSLLCQGLPLLFTIVPPAGICSMCLRRRRVSMLSRKTEVPPRRGDRHGDVGDQFDGVRGGHCKVLKGVLDLITGVKLPGPPRLRGFQLWLGNWLG